jgi:hypothetical protein
MPLNTVQEPYGAQLLMVLLGRSSRPQHFEKALLQPTTPLPVTQQDLMYSEQVPLTQRHSTQPITDLLGHQLRQV